MLEVTCIIYDMRTPTPLMLSLSKHIGPTVVRAPFDKLRVSEVEW